MLKFALLYSLLWTSLAAADFDWKLRQGFPTPIVPADNPMTVAQVELGRHLFYDRRLSANGRQSCADCHKQELAFTDGLATAKGSTGELHTRSSMSLVNIGYAPSFTWANPNLGSLEEQALVPMFGVDPIELGLKGGEEALLKRLRGDATYRRLFAASALTIENIAKAIAAFERSIVSTRSPYDRYRYGDEADAISAEAKRGEMFFFSSEKGGCFQCHGGWNLSGAIGFTGGPKAQMEFHNTGLYNLPGATSYPARNTGLHRHTHKPEDIGKFRAPTLRNIAVTAPYMHDGSIATLAEVVDHYAAGGRQSANANKSVLIRRIQLTPTDKSDLIAFLNSLTDGELLTDPRWSNPWK